MSVEDGKENEPLSKQAQNLQRRLMIPLSDGAKLSKSTAQIKLIFKNDSGKKKCQMLLVWWHFKLPSAKT